jgi:hypothetical protein
MHQCYEEKNLEHCDYPQRTESGGKFAQKDSLINRLLTGVGEKG